MGRKDKQASESETVHWGRTDKGKEEILNVRSKTLSKRNRLLKTIDKTGTALSKPVFFVVLFATHSGWILLNLPLYPWWEPWDPYPFTFLATLASVEAPFISLLVLMHQQRNSRIDELRAEIQLQVSLHVERQSSMSVRLLRELQRELRLKTNQDTELLDRMEVFLDPEELMTHIRDQMKESEGIDPAKTA